MSSLTALLAISLIQSQTGGPSQQGFGNMALANRVVRVDYPSAPIRQFSDEIKNWDGFVYASNGREWPGIFLSEGDWAPIGSRTLDYPTPGKDAPTWKVKVIILTDVDVLTKGSDGLLRQSRSRLDSTLVDSTLASLARIPGYFRADTQGAANLSLDVTVDSDPIYAEDGTFGKSFMDFYVKPRINGGTYEAEDKVFRGPYQSVFIVHPGLGATPVSITENGTVCTSLPLFSLWTGSSEKASTGIDLAVVRELIPDLLHRRQQVGLPAGRSVGEPASSLIQGVPSLRNWVQPQEWAALTNPEDLSFDQLSSLFKRPTTQSDFSIDGGAEPYRLAPVSSNVTVSIVSDTDRGSVLKYSEKSVARFGGLALPVAQITVSQTPFFGFWAKTTSRDAMSIVFSDGAKQVEVALGRDVAFTPDGQWHQIVIDLGKTGLTNIERMWLTPGKVAQSQEKVEVSTVDWLFDDFTTSGLTAATPPPCAGVPSMESSDVELRAKASKSASASALLKDSSDFVKINGLTDRETPFNAADETALIELSHSVNARVAEASIRQLIKLNTPTAKAEVLRLVNASPFERVKAIAALEVGRMDDAKLAGAVSRLFAGKSKWTRLAGAQAISTIPGNEAPIILMTFLQEIDPMIRLEVVRLADVKNPVVVKRLMWSAVNDPSDEVRAASNLRLIFSGDPKSAEEGYKGVRDESVGAKLAVLEVLAAKPSETHRKALQVAVTDLSPRVRAAALLAFAKLGDVRQDEIANTLEDKFPIVQMALLDLAKAKNIALPPTCVASLKASIDPKVVERAKELGD